MHFRFGPTKGFTPSCVPAGILVLVCSLMATAGHQAPPRATQTVILENDLVRVVEVRAEAGSHVEMREQPDKMVIVLEAAPGKNLRPGRRAEWAQGDPKHDSKIYKPAEGPTGGVSLTAARAMVIEFKQEAPKAGRTPSLPSPYKAIGENAHAVQFEALFAPGQETPVHTHGNHVAIALTGGSAELTDESGQKQMLTLKKDTALYGTATTHSSVNTGKTPLHLIVVELK